MPDPTPTLAERGEPAEVLAADAAVLGKEFAATVCVYTRTLSPAVLERVTSWEPQLLQRGLTATKWKQFAPLVRAAVLCAQPSSEDVAGDLLTDALSVTAYAAGRRIPLRPEFVFRETTTGAYLATVTPSSRPTVKSRLKALVAGVTRAATEQDEQPEPETKADGDTTGSVEPLLLDRPAPGPRQLLAVGLAGPAAAEVLAALAVVRARVRAVEPAALRREPGSAAVAAPFPTATSRSSRCSPLPPPSARPSAGWRLPRPSASGSVPGVVGEAAANLKGGDVVRVEPTASDPVRGVLVRVGDRLVPLHSAFAAPVLAAAEHAGPTGWLLGGGPSRRNRLGDLAAGLANTDAHLVRLNSSRLAATWLAMHASRGVPLGDLITAAGWTSAAPLDQVLPYLPRTTTTGRAQLAGTIPAALTDAAATVGNPAPEADASAVAVGEQVTP